MFVAHIKKTMTRNSAVTINPASGSLTVAGARIVFEPTAYDGSESSRVNFVLEASEEECQVVREWEQSISWSKSLCSALTPNALKVKIDKTGVRCWENKQRAPLPEVLKDKACNAMIQWTGAWETKNQQGLCLKVTDVEIMEQEIEYPFENL